MAIKVNQIAGSPVAAPFKDSRAEGYVTYYTKAGWDRWKLSADQVAQLVAEQKLDYQAALETYKKDLASIETRKNDLTKKLADIAIKKAGALAQQDMINNKAEQAAELATGKAEQDKAKQGSYHPSWSYSVGWSKSSGSVAGAAFVAAGGRDILEELVDGDGADHGVSAHQAITEGINASTDAESTAKALQRLNDRMKQGQLTGDQYGAGVKLYAVHRGASAKLANDLGISQEDAGKLIDDAVKKLPDGNIIAGHVSYGDKLIMDRVAGTTKGTGTSSSSESQHESKSGGGYYGKYDIPAIPITEQNIDTAPFDAAAGEVQKQLDLLNGGTLSPSIPKMEPIDVIAAARKVYMEKFGDVPRGVRLNFGNGTYGQYKNLLPYEITDGVNKTKQFFTMYINDAVSKAKEKAIAEGRVITVDELNAATEAGKAAARLVLFGGVVAADQKAEAKTGTPAPPNPIDKAMADMSAVRSSGILGPEGDAIFAALDASTRMPSVGTLNQPAGVTPGLDFNGRKGLPPTIEAAPVPTPSITPVIPPVLGTRGEQVETPEAKKKRSALDILLRGFRPALDRETGLPSVTGPQKAQAISSLTMQGANQAATFPESMHPPYPRTVEGTSFRPMTTQEFPKLPINRLDRAALGLESPVATPVTGNLPASYYNAPSALPIILPTMLKPSGKEPGVNMGEFFKNKKVVPPEAAPVPAQPKIDVTGAFDRREKSKTVETATASFMENPKAAARAIGKDNLGKYIASLYDENKSKGSSAVGIGELSSTVIREYSGDFAKQKKAIELLTQLALLDSTGGQIKKV